MSAPVVQEQTAATATRLSRVAAGSWPVALVAIAVVAFHGWIVAPSRSDWGNIDPRSGYYNLLIDGFAAGQLHLKVDVPEGLAQLPDPYDPVANRTYRLRDRLHDTSYYDGKIHLYYGVTPALVLFGPYRWLTGGYLYYKHAAFAFAALGFLASALLIHSMWRRYFASVPAWVVAGCALALGVTNSIPGLLRTPAVCEVAIAAGYAFMMLACLGVWQAVHDERRPNLWLALASVSYGLAVGARPSVLFGAAVLLVPLVIAWRERRLGRSSRPLIRLALSAIGPIFAIGVGLAAYNYLRFGDLFEFGQRYQLAGDRQDDAVHFSLRYFAYNLRLYFLQPFSWTELFPFVQETAFPPPPHGHAPVESAQGILPYTPVALFALAAIRAVQWSQGRLGWFVAGIGALFASSATVLCLFYGTVLRYQAEFHPSLVLLAAVGVLALDRGLTGAVQLAWRALFVLALAFSVTITVLANMTGLAAEMNTQGAALAQQGRTHEAIAALQRALRANPGLAPAHVNLGIVHLDSGDAQQAAVHLARALRLAPASPDTLNGYGRALAGLGRLPEAAEQFRRALALDPGFAHAHLNLATVLFHLGNHADAAFHYQRAIELGLDSPDVRQALDLALNRAQGGGTSTAPR